MTTPDVTAIVPTHDRVTLLATTLRTILWQRDVSLEVVIVDDGSREDVARALVDLRDPRVRLIRNDDPRGVSSARNRGAAEARGPWLAFCDDDDLWAPDKLARQLAVAAASGARWAYGGAVHVNLDLRVTSAKRPPAGDALARSLPRWSLMPGGSSNAIVQRNVFRDVGGWDEGLINLADWDLWAKLAATGSIPAAADAPLVGYRIHPGNASADVGLILREARVLDSRYGRIDHGRLHHYLAWVYLRSGRRNGAGRHLAIAAATGQAPAVARVLRDLAARRLERGAATDRGTQPDPWVVEADIWIGHLRERSSP
jgi:glycosyltransferase involved in cell wall biosynthesis